MALEVTRVKFWSKKLADNEGLIGSQLLVAIFINVLESELAVPMWGPVYGGPLI